MTSETAKKYLLKLKESGNTAMINEYGKALERNLKLNPTSKGNIERLEVFKELFENKNKKSKKSE